MSSKTGIPLDVLAKRGPTAKQVERMERINDSDLPRVSTQPRSRDESAEERRARKQAIKTERKVRNLMRHAENYFKYQSVAVYVVITDDYLPVSSALLPVQRY